MFNVISIGALYAGSERGLASDVLAARAMGGSAYTVCTALVAADASGVTDVTEVPADTVDAQLEHIVRSVTVHALRIGIVGTAEATEVIFRRFRNGMPGASVLDITLSGPAGEDVAGGRVREVLLKHLGAPGLVSLRRVDAELVAGMEIQSLDDAQVAVQRLHRMGARNVLIRAGRLPARHFDDPDEPQDHTSDLFYDGEEFALFEAPYIEAGPLSGASSALFMAILKNLSAGRPYAEAVQSAKGYVTEAIRRTDSAQGNRALNFLWHHRGSGDGA